MKVGSSKAFKARVTSAESRPRSDDPTDPSISPHIATPAGQLHSSTPSSPLFTKKVGSVGSREGSRRRSSKNSIRPPSDHRSDQPATSDRLVLPLRTLNRTNVYEHPQVRARRVKKERDAVQLLWPRAWRGRSWPFPVEVLLVRRGPQYLDGDGLQAALKSVRDQVADQLGVTDAWADKRVRWSYDQVLGDYQVELVLGLYHPVPR